MKEITTDIRIDAPPREVWRVLTDFESFPAWNPLITRASGEVREGARLEIFVQIPDSTGRKFSPRVLKVEPERELIWLGTLAVPGLFNGEHRFRIEPDDNGSRFVHSERFTGLLVPFLDAAGIIRKTERGYHLMNEALKRRIEGGAV
ncbi:MAG TPA: SRPBCC domain-containing protein [Pyrinomonadaceae bacterium]|nr:SRPBCC domain-containing protein [Pyrinomonadaceae bacterium]